MNALLLTDLVGSIVVIAGALAGLVRLLRGGARWVARVGENTDATEKLTEVVLAARDEIHFVVDKLNEHDERLDNHEHRLTGLEGR